MENYLVSKEVLVDETAHGDHCQATILDLRSSQSLCACTFTKIEGVEAICSWNPIFSVVDLVDADSFTCDDREDDLEETQLRDRSKGRQRARVGENLVRKVVEFRDDPAQSCKH